MKRFEYRLAKLLDLRRHIERQWEIKLAGITGICILLEKRISEIIEEIGVSRNDRFKDKTLVTYHNLLANELYARRLQIEMEQKKEELNQRKKEREEIQKEYLEHSKKRKVLEKLRERKESEYYKVKLGEEFKIMDDINSSLYIRRMEKSG
jgi:flagellar FliJ protein